MGTVIGINGSPRKKANSATMLEYALKGAESAGAETERFDLVNLNYRGCMSCFSCKRLGSPNFCKCALKDDLTPVLEKIIVADALIVAAPIYLEDVPGMVRNFYERLLFPGNLYDNERRTAYNTHVKTGLIYTMNCPDPHHHEHITDNHIRMFNMMLGEAELLQSTMTWQFDDYSLYASSRFDVQKRWERHINVFPEDCKKAFELGKRLAGEEE